METGLFLDSIGAGAVDGKRDVAVKQMRNRGMMLTTGIEGEPVYRGEVVLGWRVEPSGKQNSSASFW